MKYKQAAGAPDRLLDDNICKHIVEFSILINPSVAAVCRAFRDFADTFARRRIHQRVQDGNPRVSADWIVRLARHAQELIERFYSDADEGIPRWVYPTAPDRLLLHAVKTIPLSEYTTRDAAGPMTVHHDGGTLLFVCPHNFLRIFDTSSGKMRRQVHLPGIPEGVLISRHHRVYEANNYLVLDHSAVLSSHTVYVWKLDDPGGQNYSISLKTEFPSMDYFSVAATPDGKLIVAACDYYKGTGDCSIACYDIATGNKLSTQSLNDILHVHFNHLYARYRLKFINNDLFLFRLSGGSGPAEPGQGNTGIYRLGWEENGLSLEVRDFPPCYKGMRDVFDQGHHSGWCNPWVILWLHTADGGLAIKARRKSLVGQQWHEHDASPFLVDMRVLLVTGNDRLIVQDPNDETGEISYDEVCIYTGQVFRTLSLGCSHEEYKTHSVVPSKTELVCILRKRDGSRNCLIKTFER